VWLKDAWSEFLCEVLGRDPSRDWGPMVSKTGSMAPPLWEGLLPVCSGTRVPGERAKEIRLKREVGYRKHGHSGIGTPGKQSQATQPLCRVPPCP
jgi:hypothetical protein